jgi:hypothetical protein
MWAIQTRKVFRDWLEQQNDADRENVLALLKVLREIGPGLGRPYADTLKGSTITNLKELRVQSAGAPIRVLFAFDPNREGVILCAGHKNNEKRFYREMIALAEAEFESHRKGK